MGLDTVVDVDYLLRVFIDTYRLLCNARYVSKRYKDVHNQRSIMERRDANSRMYESKTVKQMGKQKW